MLGERSRPRCSTMPPRRRDGGRPRRSPNGWNGDVSRRTWTHSTQLRERLGVSEAEVASYWGRVRANLGSKIERELPAIVEFLDEQMRSVTVVALELSLFSNGSERILAPRLIGLTADAVDQKSAAGANLMKEVGAVCRTTHGSIAFDFDIGEKRVAPACLRANGKATISLFNLAKFALFADKESRRAFCDAWPRRSSNCPQRA